MLFKLLFRALDKLLFVLGGGIIVDQRPHLRPGRNAGGIRVGRHAAVGQQPDVAHQAVFLFAASQRDDVIVGRLTQSRSIGKVIIPGKFDFLRVVGDGSRREEHPSAVRVEREHEPQPERVEHVENALEHVLIAELLPAEQSGVPGRRGEKPAEPGNHLPHSGVNVGFAHVKMALSGSGHDDPSGEHAPPRHAAEFDGVRLGNSFDRLESPPELGTGKIEIMSQRKTVPRKILRGNLNLPVVALHAGLERQNPVVSHKIHNAQLREIPVRMNQIHSGSLLCVRNVTSQANCPEQLTVSAPGGAGRKLSTLFLRRLKIFVLAPL